MRNLIARCLVKDPKQRLRDIGDARLMLDDKDEAERLAQPAAVAGARRRRSCPRLLVAGGRRVASQRQRLRP